MKKCPRCALNLPLKAFNPSHAYCKECLKNYYLENKERFKTSQKRFKARNENYATNYSRYYRKDELMKRPIYNYKVEYIGLREGYHIYQTTDEIDDFHTFKTFKEAKAQAIGFAKNDIDLVKSALKLTKSFRKSDCERLS